MPKIIFISLFLIAGILNVFAQEVKTQEEAIFSGLPDDITEETYQFHKKPNIAVLPFIDANAKAKETEYGRTVSAMLITALRSSTNFNVVERSELQKILSEQTLDLSGLTAQRSKQIRELLQVDVILTGDVSLIETTLHIDARLFDVSTSNVVSALYGTVKNLNNIRSDVEGLAQQLEENYLRQWMGSISIASQLPAAEVYLDGKYVGQTESKKPLRIDGLLEGKYQLKLIRGGYDDWQGEIVVLAKMDRSVKVQLIPKPGSMNIYSEPMGAKIFLDNTYVGVTPMSLKEVAEGEHEIRLLKINYKPWTRKVVVRSFQPTDVKTTLEVSPGMITVNSNPTGADIYFKGKFVAQTPHTLTNIEPGEVVVRVGKEGYEEWTSSSFVKPNGHEVLDVELQQKTGSLSIISRPEGANIFLTKAGQKRQNIGQAPLLNYVVPIGNYTIEVEKEDHFSIRRNTIVYSGKLNDIDFQMRERPGSIVVSSTPENARVFLNGSFKGRAPMELKNLEKGEYLVTVKMPYASKTRKVTVQSNRTSKVSVSINKPVKYAFSTTLVGLSLLLFYVLVK